MKSLIIFIYIFCLAKIAKSQDKEINTNLQDLKFVENKIKNNYPSYLEKQNPNYRQLLSRTKKNVSQSSDSIFNFQEIATAVMFFKDLHLRLSSTRPVNFDSTFCKNKLQEAQKLAINKRSSEGYWKSDYNDCIIYLKECKREKANLFEAVVIETNNKNVKSGSIKFYITKNKIDKYNITNFITTRGIMTGIYSYFPSKDTLITGLQAKWIKLKNYHSDYLKELTPIENSVSFNIIDTNYISIKIPKSDFDTKHIVDSLVTLNKELIEKTPNLIIDIRNNTGGTWLVYKSLFPYLYTNPVIEGDGYLKCSQDFIDTQKDFVEQCKKDSNLKEFLHENERLLDSMIKYKGKFYYTKGGPVFKYDSIKTNPKKIIVLANYRCVSSSEMFLKFCQQSKKAIIAGEKTWGVLDNVEIVPFDSPSGNYKLSIPRVKMVYGKNPPLDFVGISPDINIPSTETDWNKFVITYMTNTNNP